MKRLFGLVIILIILFNLLVTACATKTNNAELTTPPLITITTEPTYETTLPPTVETTIPETTYPALEIPYQTFEHKVFNNTDDLLEEWNKIDWYIITLFDFITDVELQHPDYLELSSAVILEIEAMQALTEQYAWDYRALEYPVATEVWLYMTEEMGYSDYVAAGIMGNMMAECGGHTLNLKWWVYNSTNHYGLCQWSPKYYPQLQGASLQEQLEYMSTSFPEVITRYSYLYRDIEDFTYEDFLALRDVEAVAKAFCLIYERPGGYDARRGTRAIEAYQYFANPSKAAQDYMEE